jgi:peptidoglycan/LPS O-acetylase OafA/YrhL
LRIILVSAFSIAVASLSWFLFEKPINNLKARFPYVRAIPLALVHGEDAHFPAIALDERVST